MAADPMQGPAGPALSPLPPEEAPVEGQVPPEEAAPPEGLLDPGALAADVDSGGEHDDVAEEVTQFIYAVCIQGKAFATGEPTGIDTAKVKDAASAVQALCLGLAAIAPPTPPSDPNLERRDQTDSAKAVLQDQQHEEQVKAQLELGKRREGRPSGPAKP